MASPFPSCRKRSSRLVVAHTDSSFKQKRLRCTSQEVSHSVPPQTPSLNPHTHFKSQDLDHKASTKQLPKNPLVQSIRCGYVPYVPYESDRRDRHDVINHRKRCFDDPESSEASVDQIEREPHHKRVKYGSQKPVHGQHQVVASSSSQQIRFLQDLLQKTSSTRILRFMRKSTFANILSSISLSSKDSLLLLLHLLRKLSEDPSERIKERMIEYYSVLFEPKYLSVFHCIGVYLRSMPQEGDQRKRIAFIENVGNIIGLFGELLKTNPWDASVSLPIDACCGTLEQLSCQDFLFKEAEEKAMHLKVQRDQIRSCSYQRFCDQKVTEESTLPTAEDLQAPPSVLKENIIQGPFPGVSEYISIFTNLLREDFTDLLREKLHAVKRKEEFDVYENVRFKRCFPTDDGVTCKLSFTHTSASNIKWERSKRLTYGNLLCLSENEFETVIFATVSERDIEELREKVVTVKLIGDAVNDASCVSSSKVYKMFESPSYYEAYAPILGRLEKLNPEQFPFQQYLVNCKTEVGMPVYLKQQDTKLNLRGVICSCERMQCEHSSVDITHIDTGEIVNSSSLDPSQLKALCTALTKELTLIQGPPGTGKTYIGLKIVETLLINKSKWTLDTKKSVPIMIVCYTNHALDQFLEGLIRLKGSTEQSLHSLKIRRLGGRSKSESVKLYNINKFVKVACHVRGIKIKSHERLLTLKKQLTALEAFLNGEIEPTRSMLATYSFFLSQSIIDEIKDACAIRTSLPDLSHWGLQPQEDQENFYHDQIEADRQVSLDDDLHPHKSVTYDETSVCEFVHSFHTVEPLTEKRANQLLAELQAEIGDFPHLQLFKYCLKKLKAAWQTEVKRSAEEIAANKRRQEEIRVKCLQEADIIGVTITGAAKYNSALSQVNSKICVIEEAAEVLEPHVVCTLTNHTQHLILIGDHKQLQPRTSSYKIAHKYNLEVSLFERLIINKFPVITLEVQHRMRPEISSLVSKHIYDGLLKDSETVKEYRNVRGMRYNMYFVDHDVLEVEDPDNCSSHVNEHEAGFVVYLCKYLLQNGYKPEQITIITPYVGQMFTIRDKLNHIALKGVHVSTLDNYQGEENDIILLSLVRSNKACNVGFTRKDNRVCVAMSRAKVGFYCIGNFSMYRKRSKLWNSIIGDLEQRENSRLSTKLPLQCVTHETITEVSSANDFLAKVSGGGCDKPCKIRLPVCNHACQRTCHPDEEKHNLPCPLPCPKWCTMELHRCKGRCGEKCSPCTEPVRKVIPTCGHLQPVPCSMSPKEFLCKMECKKQLACGHPCRLTCGEDCQSKPCTLLVTRVWPCGHEAQKECHVTELEYSYSCSFPCNQMLACEHTCTGKCGKCRQGRLHKPCQEKCTRTLVCGHLCSESCARNCPPCKEKCQFKCPHGSCGNKCSTLCKPCPHPCEWECEHHKCTRNCGEKCNRPRCSEPCKKKLKCGHDCIGLCGESCPNVCRVCDKESDTFTVIFGPEDEPDARFVTLVDCNHVLEVTSLDEWVDKHSSATVDWKKCPKCKTPIISTFRYANEAKVTLQDFNCVKEKQIFSLTMNERQKYIENAQRLCSANCSMLQSFERKAYSIPRRVTQTLFNRLKRIEGVLDKFENILLENTLLLLESISASLQTIQKLNELTESISENDVHMLDLKSKLSLLNSQTVSFLEWIVNVKREHLTDQMQKDMESERRRITLLKELYVLQYTIGKFHPDVLLRGSDEQILKQVQKYECPGSKLTQELTKDFLRLSKETIRAISKRLHVPLTEDERQMVIRATGAKPGSWYKCKNGHYYQIGECGGAMETSKCPECSAIIGGAQHRLAQGNEHAGEFDNSSHAAWSAGANMANYML